jgi:DNA-binding MarR family transcriptional regulator
MSAERELKAAQRAFLRADEKRHAAANARTAAILAAIAKGGMTQADVARATGLTRGRIAQIIDGASDA